MIVVLGATGYTGRLTVEALLRRGQRPVVAGRSAGKLERLAAELGGSLATAQADVARPETLRGLVEAGDVLVSTVGPFTLRGEPAVRAAVAQGAHYVDSNGEPPFTRRVFEHHGPAAKQAGIGLLPAFGWENVAGNLAGALVLREAGEPAVRVDTGYFYTGRVRFTGGTRTSFAQAMVRPSFAFREGAIRTVRGAERYRTMRAGRLRPGVSLGASEHFSLPRVFPHLREVNAYLGWFGGLPPRAARLMPAISRLGFSMLSVPGARRLVEAGARRLPAGSGRGPEPAERRAAGVHIVGIAYDEEGVPLAEVHVKGIEGYELTAALLAWGAERLAAGALRDAGALGPAEAFGIDPLEAGCREAGLARV